MLLKPPDEAWRWASVGDYRYLPYDLTARISVLRLDYFIAAAFAVLTALTIVGGHSNEVKGLVVIAWVFFVPTIWLAMPAVVVPISAVILTVGSIVAAPSAVRLYRRAPRALLWQALLSMGAGLAFLFPYVLWAQGTVPYHEIADLFALGLGGAVVIAARRAMRRRFPDLRTPA